MGIEYFKLPIFDRRPYCDPAEWAQRYRYMKTTASMFSFEQSPYFELPNQVMGDLAGTACVVLKVPSQTGVDCVGNVWVACSEFAPMGGCAFARRLAA